MDLITFLVAGLLFLCVGLLIKALDLTYKGFQMKEELDSLKFQYGEIPEKEFDKKWNKITNKWGFNK